MAKDSTNTYMTINAIVINKYIMKKLLFITIILLTVNSFSQNFKTNTYSDYTPSAPRYTAEEMANHRKEMRKELHEVIELAQKNALPDLEYYLLNSENCETLFKRKCKSLKKRLNKYKDMYRKLTYTNRYYEERKSIYSSFDWINEMRYRIDTELAKQNK